MPLETPAQEEFARLMANNSDDRDDSHVHPEDRHEAIREAAGPSDEDEEDRFRASHIDAAMRVSTMGRPSDTDIKLPPASFDSGRTTGVKGVIADARSYEMARRSKWMNRVRGVRRSVFGLESLESDGAKPSDSKDGSAGESDEDGDEESFLQQWRESRRRELETEARGGVRNRRTSPSVRIFGRLDEVDAMGYLDAIEKVGRETVVVVFVYDHESHVSETVEAALQPLVGTYPIVHFVKVHYDDVEFDRAGVPAVLAYRNQGDLFANLTGVIEMIPDSEDCDSDTLQRVFEKHEIL